MNKSLAVNLLSCALVVTGYLMPESVYRSYVLYAGLFALSGAFTNWLAVHMLFEKVPGLYGSGVIQDRFEQFKDGIQSLVMNNFFTEDNFKAFADTALHQEITPENIHGKIDLDDLFEGFLNVVRESSFGGMLAMVGGVKALEPLRDPFKAEFRSRIAEIIDKLDLTQGELPFESMRPTIERLVRGKLDQLQPSEVKEIIAKMIRKHLGWLVVWGGACGALVGLVSVACGL